MKHTVFSAAIWDSYKKPEAKNWLWEHAHWIRRHFIWFTSLPIHHFYVSFMWSYCIYNNLIDTLYKLLLTYASYLNNLLFLDFLHPLPFTSRFCFIIILYSLRCYYFVQSLYHSSIIRSFLEEAPFLPTFCSTCVLLLYLSFHLKVVRNLHSTSFLYFLQWLLIIHSAISCLTSTTHLQLFCKENTSLLPTL